MFVTPIVLHDKAQKEIIELLEKNSSTRQYSIAELVYKYDTSISLNIVWRFIKKKGYRYIKYTVKSALTKEMKQKQLDFCLKYRNFNQRNVIQIDETSVVLSRVRVWRLPDERDNTYYIRYHWKGIKEFMFRGVSYIIRRVFIISRKIKQQQRRELRSKTSKLEIRQLKR